MAGDPRERFGSAAEFGEELREAEGRNGVSIDDMALPGGPEAEPSRELSPSTSRTTKTSNISRHSLTPPSAVTKFRPPTPIRALVPRSRLIEMLHAGERRRLTVLHAPTGFGKTTLAVQWGQVLAAEGVPVAWLNIDHDDNNVVWFLAHLIEAIRRERPALAEELGQALEEHGDEAERYVLTSLINEIHQSGERVVVILDDWHRVSDTATIEALDFLLDSACHHLQVIVTSRTQAGLPMSRMRVRDELVEIDSAALRFDVAEAQAFLVDLGGLDLELEDVAALRDSTDGWVAALQLASLSLRGSENPAGLIGHMSGRHRAIGEFLAENVLDTLEPEVLDFLLATSITERISGSLAAALAGIPRGQAMLEKAFDAWK